MSEPITKAFADSSAPVRKGEELDAARLEAYLAEQLHEPHGRLEIEQFPQGFSNLTYLVRFGSEDYVLRRPPFGNTVKSAHDMGREYNVLSKLSKVYELAPKPIVYCTDEAVLGAPFYLMERRRGVILRRKLPKDLKLDPATFRGLGTAFIDNLARLHALDFRAAGLADLGKPEGYVERQVNGWIGRYEKAKTDEWPEMDSVAKWLVENRPPESGAALIHNDYKFDNVVLDSHDLTKIIGVLDWEMCTLGDPLMDLGCTLAYWIQADDHRVAEIFRARPDLPARQPHAAGAARPLRRRRPAATCAGRSFSITVTASTNWPSLSSKSTHGCARVYTGPAVCRHESASRQPESLRRPSNCNRRSFLTQFIGGTLTRSGRESVFFAF